ncbi:hypothetical protein NSA42_03215 [Paeniclostridium sordellii]|uniref:hypothetical protein n=1 Tax=Paraclostridium sordellii TaxID=1505 RepID=UPI00214A1FE4|nr:hypothetical protein [Paeniclostridium sordellii]MCR1848279.1 hypothetical protein [Paeniclostridium sordellii]
MEERIIAIDEFELNNKINKYRRYYKGDLNRLWLSIDDKNKTYYASDNVEFHINECKEKWNSGKKLDMHEVDKISSLMFN